MSGPLPPGTTPLPLLTAEPLTAHWIVMSQTIDIVFPSDQTEGTTSTIGKWFKAVGDPVTASFTVHRQGTGPEAVVRIAAGGRADAAGNACRRADPKLSWSAPSADFPIVRASFAAGSFRPVWNLTGDPVPGRSKWRA